MVLNSKSVVAFTNYVLKPIVNNKNLPWFLNSKCVVAFTNYVFKGVSINLINKKLSHRIKNLKFNSRLYQKLIGVLI